MQRVKADYVLLLFEHEGFGSGDVEGTHILDLSFPKLRWHKVMRLDGCLQPNIQNGFNLFA